MLKVGMSIKTFPETDVKSYVHWLNELGFLIEVREDRIDIVGVNADEIYRTVNPVKLGMLLRKERMKKNISIKMIANQIGVNTDTVRIWEYGRKPNRNNFRRYCEAICLDERKILDEVSR